MLYVQDSTASFNGYFVTETKSSAIECFSFQFDVDENTEEILDKEWGTLQITFRDGLGDYFYRDVSLNIFFQMTNAKSVGAFFNSRIKGNYEFEVI